MDDARPDDLLGDLQWLQKLARDLARDPEAANEAVQDTCVAALRERGAIAAPRAWLATVLRRFVALRQRGERRQTQRQTAAARPESVTATDELVQRAELQQRLLAHVLRLSPPHRDAVLLRFFDGLPPRAIARRLQVPVATIHSRLQRAQQQLRASLDDDHGGRAQWAALALVLPAAAVALPFLGVLMQTKSKVLIATLLAAGTVTWWYGSGNDAAATAVPDETPRSTPARSDGGGGGESSPMGAHGRTRAAAPSPAASGEPVAAPEKIAVRGRVCDCTGVPMAGVAVAAGGVEAKSDGVGTFELLLSPAPASIAIADERYVTVLGASWRPGAKVEPVLVAAPALRLQGRVEGPDGGGIADAEIQLQLPADFDARFPVPLDRAEQVRERMASDADGRFRLLRLPRIDGASLLVTAPALRPEIVPLPAQDNDDLRIRLQPFAYEQGQLDGLVVDPQGLPVVGARVAMGVTSVESGADGRFALLLRRAGWPTAITACKQGYLPARCELPRNGGARREDWPERVVLQLGGSPLSLAGRVIDQKEQPIAGALVWIADPTLLGIAGVLPVQTEYVLAGGAMPRHFGRMPVHFVDDPTKDGMFMDSASDVDDPTACWYFVTADEHGRFELPGLLPRDYKVRVFDPSSGIGGDAGPVPAGGSVEVRIVRTGLWPEVRGRVVGVSGAPLAGVEVDHQLRLFSAKERVPGGHFEGIAIRRVQRVVTGADGTFVLRDVHPERSTLSFGGDTILPCNRRATAIGDPLQVEIEAEARCHVEVVLVDPGEADRITATTASGEEREITVLRAGSTSMTTELPLHDGRSGVFVLGERTAVLSLRKGDRLVRTVPLHLVPGETFRVQ